MQRHQGFARRYRYTAESLAAAVVESSADPKDFVMLIGIGDSVAFDYSVPNWEAPDSIQDRCYVGVVLPHTA